MAKRNVSTGVDYDMYGVTINEFQNLGLMEFVSAIKSGRQPLPIMAYGQPGIGKTFSVYAIGDRATKELGLKSPVQCHCLLAGCMEPTDVIGVPHRAENGKYTEYLPLKWAYDVSTESPNKGPAIVFMDDLSVAHPQTQAAFFKFVHERMMGDLRLRDNVMIIGAGNRPEDNAQVNDTPTPLANRFINMYVKLNPTEWLEWALKDGTINPYVIAYLRRHQDHLNTFDPDSQEKGFATPRSWQNLSRSIEIFQEPDGRLKETPTLAKFAYGTVGTGVATGFMAFLRSSVDSVAPEEIIKNPLKVKLPSVKELDALYATITSLEVYFSNNPKTWKQVFLFLTRKSEIRADLATLLAIRTIDVIVNKMDDAEKRKVIMTPEWQTISKEYKNIAN